MATATYKDIQRMTGLSLSTISKYFNGAGVRAENAAAIAAAAQALGFQLNDVARGLRSGRSQTVGILVPALDNAFILAIVAGVERHLRAHGLGVLVAASGDEPTSGEAGGSTATAVPAASAVEALRAKMVDGIVAVPSLSDVGPLAAAAAAGTPVVTVDRALPGLDTDHVQLDNRAAGALAAHHLLDHGHRRIGLLGGSDDVASLAERRDGFVDALRARGVAPDPAWLTQSPLTIDEGRRVMQRVLSAPERPTAVFAGNYDLTVGGLIALNESGLTVPDDLSLVGFDLADLARITHPRTTSIAQPMDEIATAAASLLLARIAGDAPAERVVRTLSPDLAAGQSVQRIG